MSNWISVKQGSTGIVAWSRLRSSRLGANASRQQGWVQLYRSQRRQLFRQPASRRAGRTCQLCRRNSKAVCRMQRRRHRRTASSRPPKDKPPNCTRPKSRVLGWADPETYPLQKKRHTFEKLREWAHLRPRTNSFGAVTRVRNQISQSIHQFFHEHGFLYTNTPIITASDCEGAGEMFRVTSLDLEMLAKSGGPVNYSFDFFDKPAYLTVSGQLEAETYATALGRVYTFGPTFRAENSNTSRHLAEFWMVEPEAAFFDLARQHEAGRRFFETGLQRLFEPL